MKSLIYLPVLVIALLGNAILADGHFSVQLRLSSLTSQPVQTTLSLLGSEKTLTVTGAADVTIDYKLTPAQLTDTEPVLLDVATVTAANYHMEAVALPRRGETSAHTVAGLLRVVIQKPSCAKHYYGAFCARKCTVPAGDKYSTCDADGKLTCAQGWTGPACDQRACPACKHGRCDETTGQCVCKIGFTGPACDQCTPAAGCRNGGCRNDTPGTCACRAGWGGPLCENDLSMCASRSPCARGSKCEMKDPYTYICVCPAGKTGRHCELDDVPVPPVSTQQTACPCQNGGVCLPTYPHTSVAPLCQCALGFVGRLCETTVPTPHNNSVLIASNIVLCLIVFCIGCALIYLIFLARRYLKSPRPAVSPSSSTAPMTSPKMSSVSLLMPDCAEESAHAKGAGLFAAAQAHAASKMRASCFDEEPRYSAGPRKPSVSTIPDPPTVTDKIYESLPV